MLQKIGCFHFGNPDKSRPLLSLENSIKARLAAQGEDDLRDSLIVLPEAFNLRGEYESRDRYEVDPATAIKHRLGQLGKLFGIVFVVGLIDNDEALGPTPPLSSVYLSTSTCCCRLCHKAGKDDMAQDADGGALYQPSLEPADAPFLHEQTTWIAGLLCMDAVTHPNPNQPYADNRERHNKLKARMAKLGAETILCVPARMRALGTKEIEREWPQMHFALANSCRPTDSRHHPSVIRLKDQNRVMFPEDEFKPQKEMDALIVESLPAMYSH
jgi:predicted amidohydrolase